MQLPGWLFKLTALGMVWVLALTATFFAVPTATTAACSVFLSGSFDGGSDITPSYTLDTGDVITVMVQHSVASATVMADVRLQSPATYITYGSAKGRLTLVTTATAGGTYDSFIRDDGTPGTTTWSIAHGNCSGDSSQADSDRDGINDASDNCPQVANPRQEDGWGKLGIGDACEEHYNRFHQFKAFPQRDGTMHIYSDCIAASCELIAIVDIESLHPEKALRIDPAESGWYVIVYPLNPEPESVAYVYQANVYRSDDVLTDDHLEIVVYPDGQFDWRAATTH